MMTHQQIKKALHDQNLTFSYLAKATGKQSQNIISCASRKSKSKPCALIISAALGKPIEQVFSDVPSYLTPDKALISRKAIDKTHALLRDAGLDEYCVA